ncbi:phage tail assembly chaperone [Sphingomonas sp. BAUL-RG-20F-R05-02]|nr:phage tail assembly chaperone [Sphingomonas sp. BAUL-RG-20F-R05-02]
MGVAAAALGWRPREFWASTPSEFWAAIRAYERMHCVPEGT